MDFKDLAIKVITEQSTPDEFQILQELIGQNVEKRLYFNELKQAWQISCVRDEGDQFDADKAWLQTLPKLQSGEALNKNSHLLNLYRIVKIAAMIMLAFIIGGLSTYFGIRSYKSFDPGQDSMNEIVSPKGAKSRVILPDGTEVWLNALSKLRYSQAYNINKRDVFLEGEAFFKVKSNRKRPFVVNTPGMSVKALGTIFNVKAYPEENTITTTLVEGKVRIEGIDSHSNKFEIALKPNQQLTFKKNSTKYNVTSAREKTDDKLQKSKEIRPVKNISPISIDNGINTLLYTSWKDDRWIIEHEKLANLIILLERRYNVTFLCKSDALKSITFTGTIRKESIEQVLDIIRLTSPLNYTIMDGTIILDLDESRSDTYLKAVNKP